MIPSWNQREQKDRQVKRLPLNNTSLTNPAFRNRQEITGAFLIFYIQLIYYYEKKGEPMAYYVVLSTLTDEGRKTIKENPKRILEVNKEIEKMGIKVKEQYAVLGPYDFVNIVEAPDNETVMKMSVELGSRGSVHLLTLAAIPVSEFIKKLK